MRIIITNRLVRILLAFLIVLPIYGEGCGDLQTDDNSVYNYISPPTGTTKKTIYIEDWQGLQNMKNDLTARYILKNDIPFPDPGVDGFDSNGFAPVGNDINPTVDFQGIKFSGILDGAGHKITNFYMNRGSQDFVGIFGYVIGGTINDLYIELRPGDRQNPSVTGKNYVGVLAGALEKVTINNVVISGGHVEGVDKVGGLVGNVVDASKIDICYSRSDVTGYSNVGGFIGAAGSSTQDGTYTIGSLLIKNNYSLGNVIGSRNVGGFIGSLISLAVEGNYAKGLVTAENVAENIGGFAGIVNNLSTLTSNYYSDSTGQANGIGADTRSTQSVLSPKTTLDPSSNTYGTGVSLVVGAPLENDLVGIGTFGTLNQDGSTTPADAVWEFRQGEWPALLKVLYPELQ